jgi:phosphohistidine phosphatase
MAEMQRHLVLLRHAKSAWPDGVSDHRRPLTDRGRRDATAAGGWLREHVPALDAVVLSPAERTRETWALVAAELDPPPAAREDDRIYGAPPVVLLDVVDDLPDEAATVLLIGHNPGLQDVVTLLSGEKREMKTASVAVLGWTGEWTVTGGGLATLEQHATPRGARTDADQQP